MKQDAYRDCFSDCVMYCNRNTSFLNFFAGSKTVGQEKSASVSWRKVGA